MDMKNAKFTCKPVGYNSGLVTMDETDGYAVQIWPRARAQFVTTACNSHYKLLEACRRAEVNLLYLLVRAEATNWLPEDIHSKVNDCHILLKQAIAAAEGESK